MAFLTCYIKWVTLLAFILLVSLVGYWEADLKEIGWVKANMMFAKSLDFVVGMVLDTTIAHFVIDAGAWRLSQPSVRNYMAKRFGFLFKSVWAEGGSIRRRR